MEETKRSYNGIDLAKFICAILILMAHVSLFGDPQDELGILLDYGVSLSLAHAGVPFFFVYAGFFLFRKVSLRDYRPEPAKKYALHILKLYILWSLVYLPLRINAMLHDPSGLPHAAAGFLRDCIFNGSFYHLWYFPALIFAVLLLSFLLYKKVPPKAIFLAAFALYLIGLPGQSWFGLIRPLEQLSPPVWRLLKLVEKVIYSTRSGLFYGFPYVCMGMAFARFDVRVPKKLALPGFLLSQLLFFGEAYFVRYIGSTRSNDLLLFQIPLVFFGVCLSLEAQLPDRPIYKLLRKLSFLLYSLHILVFVAVHNILLAVDEALTHMPLVQFSCTLILTLAVSLLVLKLAERPKFKWLQVFYT